MTRFAADRPLGVAPATALDYRELARRRLPRQLAVVEGRRRGEAERPVGGEAGHGTTVPSA